MNEKSELKILTEFINIIDDPDKSEKRFIFIARLTMFISVLTIFFCLSGNLEQKNYLVLFAFIAGTFFGLGIWFFQAGTQTKIMVNHVSRESIDERIKEINT